MSTQTEAYGTVINQVEELEGLVGKEIGVSQWIEISQKRINTFAENTEDMQWIHIDPEKSARESPYKTTIAHGFLVLSMASQIAYQILEIKEVGMSINYGLNKVRFTNAVLSGSHIRGRITMQEYKAIPGGARYIMNLVFEIKGQERPACIAEWVGQAYAKP